jgi:pimeloyl-ACP methyl ester carboxylesterase
MPASHRPMTPLRVSKDHVRGLVRLGVDATVGITEVAEHLHAAILSRIPFAAVVPDGRTAGLTGFVYRTVRRSTRWVGQTLDRGLTAWPDATTEVAADLRSEAFRAVLNGVWGDHLAASGNPLAIPMQFRLGGRPLTQPLPGAGPRVAVLLHGLCMNDLQWQRRGHDHGRMLAALGWTPVYLHYNTGRHISLNGQELAGRLETLLQAWPVPVREVALVGHSMGGLVARSACHAAEQRQLQWPGCVTSLVCLGSPHHGATLERGGHLVDLALGLSRYAAPFARLGRARSAGITDLRFGNLQEADWHGRERHHQAHDDRQPVPWPSGVTPYLVAACLSEQADTRRARLLGDGLVPLASALGEHRDPRLDVSVPASQRVVVVGANHFDLLDSAAVAAQLRRWLTPRRSVGTEPAPNAAPGLCPD